MGVALGVKHVISVVAITNVDVLLLEKGDIMTTAKQYPVVVVKMAKYAETVLKGMKDTLDFDMSFSSKKSVTNEGGSQGRAGPKLDHANGSILNAPPIDERTLDERMIDDVSWAEMNDSRPSAPSGMRRCGPFSGTTCGASTASPVGDAKGRSNAGDRSPGDRDISPAADDARRSRSSSLTRWSPQGRRCSRSNLAGDRDCSPATDDVRRSRSNSMTSKSAPPFRRTSSGRVVGFSVDSLQGTGVCHCATPSEQTLYDNLEEQLMRCRSLLRSTTTYTRSGLITTCRDALLTPQGSHGPGAYAAFDGGEGDSDYDSYENRILHPRAMDLYDAAPLPVSGDVNAGTPLPPGAAPGTPGRGKSTEHAPSSSIDGAGAAPLQLTGGRIGSKRIMASADDDTADADNNAAKAGAGDAHGAGSLLATDVKSDDVRTLEMMDNGWQRNYAFLRGLLLICELLWLPIFISGLTHHLDAHWFVPYSLVADAMFLPDLAMRLRLVNKRRTYLPLRQLADWLTLSADVAAFVPIDLVAFAAGGSSQLVSCLRINRLVRIAQLSKQMRTLVTSMITWAHAVNILLMAGSLLIIMHWLGCIWFLVGSHPRDAEWSWLLNQLVLDAGDEPVTTLPPNVSLAALEAELSRDLSLWYLRSLYWSLTTVTTTGYGEIVPLSMAEMASAIVVIFWAHVLTAYVFGLISSSFSRLDTAANNFQMQRTSFIKFLSQRHLSHDASARVVDYLHHVWRETRGVHEDEVLPRLPEWVREDISWHLYSELLKKVPLFGSAGPQFLQHLMSRLTSHIFPPDELVMLEGELGKEMYFILKGRCDVLVGGSAMTRVAVLEEGTYFGEIALLVDVPRTATIRTKQFCVLLQLKSTALQEAMREHKEEATAVQQELLRRRQVFLKERDEAIKLSVRNVLERDDNDFGETASVSALPGSTDISKAVGKKKARLAIVPKCEESLSC